MIILSGDIGGTNSRLQLTHFKSATDFSIITEHKYQNNEFESFTHIIKEFFKRNSIDAKTIEICCLAVAGPIIDGAVKFTNLPWYIEEKTLKRELNFKFATLINDFEAIGYGIDTLKKSELHVLQKGQAIEHKTRAIIGAGTGLGVGISIHNGKYFHVIPTEGGHVDYAPTDDIQIALLQFLRKKLHRVSIERIVSGPGLINVYNFVSNNPLFNETENPGLKLALFKKEDDAAALISEYATEHHDPMAMRALDLFIRVYGACAGNLALTTLPYSGLYIVGGIAPRILPQLIDGRFMRAYADKGRMSNLLSNIPIYVVLNTNIGLQGAANYAYLKAH